MCQAAHFHLVALEVPNPDWFANNCMEWDSDCGNMSPWMEAQVTDLILFANALTPGGDPGGGGSAISRGRSVARLLLSDKDCADFLKALLVKAGSAPNLDTFLKNFDSLTIVPTPPGDKNGSTLYTAHVDQVGQNSTVHAETDARLAQDASGSYVSPGGGISASRALFLNSRAASAAFDKNCDPSKVKS